MMLLEAGSSSFSITDALSTATTLVGWVFDTISNNPILTAVFVVGTLIPVGIGVFSYLKGTIR